MNDRQSSAARFATIDVLRGAAALFVACLHIRETAWIGMRDFWHLHPSWSSPDTWIALLSAPVMFGSFGVSAFFVISGYCIHRAHASRLSRDATYRVDGGRFWFRRLVRIYPVLLAALLLTLLCDTLSERLVPGFYKLGELGPGTFALNLLAMEGLFAHPFGSNGPLWTLAIEIQLYAVYPLVFLVRRRFGISWTLGAALALSALSWFVFERRGLSLFASYQFSWVLGAYVADRETMGRPPVSRQGAAPGLSRLVGFGGVLLVGIGCAVFMVSQYLAFQIWALGFAMALAWLLEHPLRIGPIAGAFRQVGHFSYSLYAIHLPLAVLAVCLVFDGRKQASPLPALLIVCLTIVCAYVFHLAFERPFVAWLARRPESKGLRSVEPVAKNVN
jgi:peptidoglycan/LPS O-acetylase OafA/YrhL